eukprot:EG_transcript_18108
MGCCASTSATPPPAGPDAARDHVPVLLFFQDEYHKYLVPADRDEEVRQQLLRYSNATQAVECHNEMIAYHVDELRQLRAQVAGSARDAAAAARLEHCKLDLGDQRTKRNLKRREQREAFEELCRHMEFVQATCPTTTSELAEHQQAHHSAKRRPLDFVLPSRAARKYRVWNDDELLDLLRDDDASPAA